MKAESHRRYNPLMDEWVLLSPQRERRPWLGQVEALAAPAELAHDPACYLCPGNARVGGQRNPEYTGTYIFENDFPALAAAPPPPPRRAGGLADRLLRSCPESGVCRVVCFSPRHDLTLARLPNPAVAAVVDAWQRQQRELTARPDIRTVTIFENRGAMMGASNPHPHGQIWANSRVPTEQARELACLAAYRADHGTCLLCDYLQLELERGERIVCANDDFVALVPYWATWPFETLLLSRRHQGGIQDAAPAPLADILRQLLIRYDNLFETPFPNSWGFHLPPHDGAEHPECHLHAHFFPPLLRSATIRKFLVGYELLSMPQRDLTPETAAARLRGLSARHYLDRIESGA